MTAKKTEIKRCAIYTRKSVEDGLEQEFNSLDAQREAGENYIASQKSNGWICLPEHYDDGGFSGGNTNRPALKKLLADCETGQIDIIVVYKIDRLSRSICDFAGLSQKFDQWDVAFVSVTQEINTHTSAGRMMLNILITFAQFEREVITERVRDKMAASRLKGKWVGGAVPPGYRVENKKLVIVPEEAEIVKRIFTRYIEIQSPRQIVMELNRDGIKRRNGEKWQLPHIYRILNNITYTDRINYKGQIVQGEQQGFISDETWDETQRFLSAQNQAPGRTQNLETIAPLKGILRCGHCNCAMAPTYGRKRGKKYLYYICTKDTKRSEKICPVHQVSAGEIDAIVQDQLASVFTAPEIIAKLSRLSGLNPRAVNETFGKELWQEMSNGEKQRLMTLLIDRAIIRDDGLTLEIRTAGIKEIMEEIEYANENN